MLLAGDEVEVSEVPTDSVDLRSILDTARAALIKEVFVGIGKVILVL